MHIHEYRRVSFIHCLFPKGLAYDQTKFIGKWSLKTGNFYIDFDKREWSLVGIPLRRDPEENSV